MGLYINPSSYLYCPSLVTNWPITIAARCSVENNDVIGGIYRSTSTKYAGYLERPSGSTRATGMGTGWYGTTIASHAVNTYYDVAGVFGSYSSRYTVRDSAWSAQNTTSIGAGSFDQILIHGYREGAGAIGSNAYAMRIQHFAVWNIALEQIDTNLLFMGESPERVRPEALVHFWDFNGNLIDKVNGFELVPVGAFSFDDFNDPNRPPRRRSVLNAISASFKAWLHYYKGIRNV